MPDLIDKVIDLAQKIIRLQEEKIVALEAFVNVKQLETLEYTQREGSMWLQFDPKAADPPSSVHAVKFLINGRVCLWDSHNGFRTDLFAS